MSELCAVTEQDQVANLAGKLGLLHDSMDALLANCVVRPPFEDPEKEESKLIQEMLERISALDARDVEKASTDMERHPKQLACILKRCNHHLEGAMSEWEQWRDFRRFNKADSITAESVKELVAAGLAEWKGTDLEGRPCLIVTGRNLTSNVPRVPALFRQFIIYLAETQLRAFLDMEAAAAADGVEDESPISRTGSGPRPAPSLGQAVVIYDRRGLLFEHIDINLYRDCRDVLSDVRRFYSDRLHCFYILFMTWGHWAMYYLLLKPLLGLTGNAGKFVAIDDEPELLQYFPQTQISFLQPFYSGRTSTFVMPAGGDGGGLPVMMQGTQTAVEPNVEPILRG